MQEIDKLLKETVAELDRLLQARNVVGEPVTRGDVTVMPLVSFGFGFGAGSGARPNAGGESGGIGGGGGIKPLAVLIIDGNGTRVESIKGQRATVIEAVGDAIGKVAAGVATRHKNKDVPPTAE
jgi:uncharacterized spore protein YtfJ